LASRGRERAEKKWKNNVINLFFYATWRRRKRRKNLSSLKHETINSNRIEDGVEARREVFL
jgi:hypothetical protein